MANLEEAVVATLFDQSDEIANEVLYHMPLMALLDEAGKIKRKDLGYEIRKPILYNTTAVGGFYSGFESFELDSIDELTAFRFGIKQAYEPLAISGRDRRANRGEEQLLDHVDTKMEGTISRLKNTVSVALLGDGTSFGGRSFDGIAKGVASSPSTGTYGQIDRATNTFARNLAISVSGGFSASNIQSELTDGITQLTRGAETPDFGISDRTTWKYLHNSLTAIQRVKDGVKKALAGFRAINYDGVDFVFDGGYGGATLATSMRLLNTKYWSFDMVRGADFKPLEPKMDRPIDQDAFFSVIIIEGNLCCSAPALQAYMA